MRKTGFILVVSLIAFLILRFLVGIGIEYYRLSHLPPPAPPDVRFGKLAYPKFKKDAPFSAGYSFSLENIAGSPPVTTASAKVYSMPKKFYTFDSGAEATKLAEKLDFYSAPTVDTVYYYFSDEQNPLRTLFIDSVHLNFQLRYNYLEDPSVFSEGTISSEEQAINDAKNFVVYNNLFDSELLKGEITSQIYRYENGQFNPATSLSTTQAIRVNFFRKDLDEMKVLPDEFDKSFNYILYAKATAKNLRDILELSYIYWPIDYADFASYPLKTGAEAYQALLEGKATIVNQGNNSSAITIREIYLAYYDSSQPQLHLQPIFVFEGDNNFVAFLPAIRPEWLE